MIWALESWRLRYSGHPLGKSGLGSLQAGLFLKLEPKLFRGFQQFELEKLLVPNEGSIAAEIFDQRLGNQV